MYQTNDPSQAAASGSEKPKDFQTLLKQEVESAKDFGKTILEVENSAKELAIQFGLGNERLMEMKRGMADAATSVALMGGDFSFIVKTQKEVAGELGRNVVLSSDLYSKFYATSQVTGESAKNMVAAFKNIGMDSRMAMEGMEQVVSTARSQGVNAQAVSKEVLANMEKMNMHSFQNGVEGLSKMAAQAVGLRINMNTTFQLAEKLFDPEKAIEMAAAMQRLGVTQSSLLDPLKLMNMAQMDPAELQNQIVEMSQQFVKLNEAGRFEIMPGARLQMKEIASAMGMTTSELSRMAIGSAELSKKMSEIKFSSNIVSEDDRKMIANMAELGSGGKYEVSYFDKDKGEIVKKAVSELRESDVKALKEASEQKPIEKIQSEQLTIQNSILSFVKGMSAGPRFVVATSKGVEETLRKTQNLTEEGKKMVSGFDVKKIREQFEVISGEIGGIITNEFKNAFQGVSLPDSIKQMFSGELTVEKMTEGIEDMWKSASEELVKVIRNFKPDFDPNKLKERGRDILEQAKKNLPELPVNDFVIKPLPQDQIRIVGNQIVGGTNLDGSTPGKTNTTDFNGSLKIDLNITSSNSNLNTNQILEAMEKQQFKEKILETIKDSMRNKTGQISNPLA